MGAIFQKRWVRVGIALVVIAVAIVAWDYRNCVWPRYQGHSASWWLDQVDPGSVESEYALSVEAFRAMGPPAVRYLGRTMASRNFLHQDSVEYRQAAAEVVLARLGTDAMPALPFFVRLFRRTGLGDDEMFALSSVMAHFPAKNLEFLTPELIADVKVSRSESDDYSRLLGDIRLLDAIGPLAKSAMPALWNVITRRDPIVMSDAAIALWHIGQETNALLQCLSNCLDNHEVMAASLLMRINELPDAPRSIIPLAEQALRHPRPRVRQTAAAVLEKMDAERLRRIEEDLNRRQDELLQADLRLLQSTNALDRANAAMALQFFGPKAVAAAPRLIEILNPPVSPPHPFNGFFLVDDKGPALWALKLLGSNANVVTPGLVDLLHTPLRQQICGILANIGPPAAAAIPTLQALLATNYVMVPNGRLPNGSERVFCQEIVPRWQVARALASINPHDSNAIAVLREAVIARRRFGLDKQMGEDLIQSLPAATTLWKLGLETNSPLDKLISCTENADGWSTDLLGNIGPAAKRALPILEKRLKERHSDRGAALAILQIDPQEAKRVGLPGLFILCPDKY